MSIPKVINWFFTGKCNLNCKFCYGKFNEDYLTLAEKKNIVDKIQKSGVKELVITGGEPLVDEDVYEIIKYAKNKGIFVRLHTNGVLLTDKNIKKLVGNVGRISLVLEGSTNKVNFDTRGIHNFFDLVTQRIDLIKKYKLSFSIKTVASKKNIDNIPELIPILNSCQPEHWFISEFRAVGRGKLNKDDFTITKKELNKLKKQCKDAKFDISIRSDEEGANSPFFFIDSNGEVFTSNEDDLIKIGSFFEEEVTVLWDKIKRQPLSVYTPRFK